MNNTLNISNKINSSDKKAIVFVKEIADKLNIPFFIIGARARDYILEYCYKARITRKTEDIDFGIKVPTWEDYEKFEENLVDNEKFKKGRKINRFIFNNEVLVDIIPFGNLSEEGRIISWPPEHEIIMTILGFDEAYRTALKVIISEDPKIAIKVPALAGLTIMKLISWYESIDRREKDARDIYKIMTNYNYNDNIDRLFNEEREINENEEWKIDNASLRLLGKDMKKIASKKTASLLEEILKFALNSNKGYPLVADMRMVSATSNDSDIKEMLRLLTKGMKDKL
ncbi:MAG: nucleotidyl transferase AbiEii/AbiGii toxin family protein [Elusimicrobiota bacterium]